MKRTIFTLIIAVFFFSSAQQSTSKKAADPNQEFDGVILSGRVIDPETNFDAVRNVGVRDGKIAIITEVEINGKETAVLPNQHKIGVK